MLQLLGLGAAATTLALQLAIRVDGVVLDPQGYGVPGARIMLTCGATQLNASSSEGGAFQLRSQDFDGCLLEVTHDGFAAHVQTLAAALTGPIVVRLSLATVRAEVSVAGTSPITRLGFGVDLAEDDFRRVASNTADLIRHAQRLAGADGRPRTVYVDGMPAATLPPIDLIARIAVDTDPFSAEYADGSSVGIHMTTRAPARRFRITAGGTGLDLGGGNLLAPRSERRAKSGNVLITGPVPRLPLTFSLNAAVSRESRPVPVIAVLPDEVDPARGMDATEASRSYSAGLELQYFGKAGDRARVVYRESRTAATNTGAGQLVLAEAGAFTRNGSREGQLAASRVTTRHTVEIGLSAAVQTSALRANSADRGVTVPGFFTMGGSPMAVSTTSRSHWTLRQVVRTMSQRPWSAGAILDTTVLDASDVANPHGSIEFDSMEDYSLSLHGERGGDLVLTRSATSRLSSITASSFIQKVLMRNEDVEVQGGIRADYQREFGAIVSPRLSATTSWHGYNVTVGAGLFARDVPDFVLWRAVRDDSETGGAWLGRGIALNASEPALEQGQVVSSKLDKRLKRPREWMGRMSIERSLKNLTTGIEYARVIEAHLLGSRRSVVTDRVIDTVESNRGGDRHQVHVQQRYRKNRLFASLHYVWTRARNNTDGPWSFAEDPDDLRSEWAPAGGTTPHAIVLAGSFTLPGAVSLTASNAWQAGMPYNITTGLDASGDGVRVDRGGRSRNSARTPASNSLSLHAHRRVALPDRVVPGKRRLHVNIGVSASNVLNNTSYFGFNSVAGSPSFGRPSAALPGRALRVTLAVG